MKSILLIRIASALTLLFAVLHASGSPWTPTNGVAESAVVAAMRDVHFVVLGSDRTYWAFYQGFGYSFSVLLAAQAVLLWLFAGQVKRGAPHRAIAVTHAACFVGLAVVSAIFIFSVPVVFNAVLAVLLFVAAALPSPAQPKV